MTNPVATSPRAYVIAGPNGAGKTTFATQYLPSFVACREFVNANLIAWGLSPFAPEGQAMRAGRRRSPDTLKPIEPDGESVALGSLAVDEQERPSLAGDERR